MSKIRPQFRRYLLRTNDEGIRLPQEIPVGRNFDWRFFLDQLYTNANMEQRPLIYIYPRGGGDPRIYTLGNTFNQLLEMILDQNGEADPDLDEYTDEFSQIIQNAESIYLTAATPALQNWQGAGFFPYWCISPHIQKSNHLERYQIFCESQLKDEAVRSVFNDNCFIYTCRMSGIFTTAEMHMIKNVYGMRKDITTKCIHKFAEDMNLHITIHRYRNAKVEINTQHFGDRSSPRKFNIAQHEKHWFLYEKVKYQGLSIKWTTNNEVTSLRLIKILMDRGLFQKITMKQSLMLTNQFFNNRLKFDAISLSESNYRLFRPSPVYCCDKLMRDKECSECHGEAPAPKIKEKPFAVFYADTETYEVDHGDHIELKPYIIMTVGKGRHHNVHLFNKSGQMDSFFNELYRSSGATPETIKGKKIVVYFHNLKFDFCQVLSQMPGYDGIKILRKDNTVYRVTFSYKCNPYHGRTIGGCTVKFEFRCSCLMMGGESLESCASTYLDTKEDHKHPCLYSWYCYDNLDQKVDTWENISNCYTQRSKTRNPDKVKAELSAFREFISDKTQYWTASGEIKMWKFYIDYCRQDCFLLRDTFEKFRILFRETLDIDPVDYLTISSLAEAYYYREGAFQDVYEMSGIPQMFCQKAVVGGRCMTAWNKSYHVQKKTEDYDACSLYPSAMMRQGFPTGKPYLFQGSDVQKYAYYIARVRITKLDRKLPFPVIGDIDDTGGRRFSNDIVGKEFIVDKNTIEDFRRFQKGEVEIIEGYAWRGLNTKVQQIVQKLYDLRNLYKTSELEPYRSMRVVEKILKLILNSAYGKTITRMSEYETVIKTNKTKDPYIYNNYYNIRSCDDLGHHILIDRYKEKNDHWNRPHIGAGVLSMSKRIMNEVMDIADRLGVQIYYTDTDSMQIDSNGLWKVENQFQLEYGRSLKGADLGNFHCDFSLRDSKGKKVKDPYSIEGIYLGKKMYACRLESESGDKGYHLVMKGIPNSLVKWDHYLQMMEDHSPKFNLLEAKVGIRTTKFQTTIPMKFERSVRRPDTEIITVS